MKTKLETQIKKELLRRLTQEEKFRLRYGNDYMQVLGTKQENPIYNQFAENVLIPDKFGGKA